MPHMIRLKCTKNTIPRVGAYIYINVDSIHAIQPHDRAAVISFGNGDAVFVEHKPGDIVLAIESDHVSVTDGLSLGD